MSYLAELIAHTEKQLQRWQGHNATLQALTRSHATLSVAIFGKDRRKNLVIYCIDPEHICGPLNWADSAVQMIPTQLADGTAGVALVDERNGVRITASSFEVAENVRL
jgi:hypothetical protein